MKVKEYLSLILKVTSEKGCTNARTMTGLLNTKRWYENKFDKSFDDEASMCFLNEKFYGLFTCSIHDLNASMGTNLFSYRFLLFLSLFEYY